MENIRAVRHSRLLLQIRMRRANNLVELIEPHHECSRRVAIAQEAYTARSIRGVLVFVHHDWFFGVPHETVHPIELRYPINM